MTTLKKVNRELGFELKNINYCLLKILNFFFAGHRKFMNMMKEMDIKVKPILRCYLAFTQTFTAPVIVLVRSEGTQSSSSLLVGHWIMTYSSVVTY